MPSWCVEQGNERNDEDNNDDEGRDESEDEEDNNSNVNVGAFIHKEFSGTMFGGVIVATDTCKTTKKRM